MRYRAFSPEEVPTQVAALQEHVDPVERFLTAQAMLEEKPVDHGVTRYECPVPATRRAGMLALAVDKWGAAATLQRLEAHESPDGTQEMLRLLITDAIREAGEQAVRPLFEPIRALLHNRTLHRIADGQWACTKELFCRQLAPVEQTLHRWFYDELVLRGHRLDYARD